MKGLIFFIIVIIIGVFISKKSKRKKVDSYQKKPPTTKPIITQINSVSEDKILYKQKGIKSFDMKGMYYQDLNLNKHKGEFIGHAKCEDNSHDMYAVGIYNLDNELLGYTPKGNKRLNHSLTEWNNGKVPAWGCLYYDDYYNKWEGTVYIPVGLTTEQTEKIGKILKLKFENQNQIKKKEKTTDKYFEILKRHNEITNLITDLNNPEELKYSFPKNLIPAISSHLEKEKNWEKLLELEKFQDLISELSEKWKESTLKRIENAKNNIAKH